jgi:hypothetical protein
MDRRQLLFGATALGLVANLNLNHLLVAQVSTTTLGTPLSDREKDGLHGLVKTCSEFTGDDTEPMSETEYAADGRIVRLWQGRTFASGGEIVYSYDGMGRLIAITRGGADGSDEFHYDEQGKKTRVRTVPPRPDRQNTGLSVEAMFEATEEGWCLIYGGSVTTRYNDDDQPIESLVRDAQGELLAKIVHNYADGRLISETLVQESFELPAQFRDQLPEEQRRAIAAKMKAVMDQAGLGGSMERSYVYDKEGRVIRRLMRMGNLQQDWSITYNEHGDVAGIVMIQRGSVQLPNHPNPVSHNSEMSFRYLYEYDSHGNWTEKTTDGSPSPTRRNLSYY